jgi:type IX secretion system PorP/SprF family membrane protein
MKKTFSVFIFLCAGILHAQDIHFSMPYSSGTNLNPALAGAFRSSKIYFNYQNEWPDISGTNVTTSLNYDRYIPVLGGGIGLSCINSSWSQGACRRFLVNGIYSKRISVSRDLIVCPAIEGSYGQNSLDWKQMNTGSGIVYTQNKQVVSYPDFSTGILGYTRHWNMGVSFSHITQPEEGFGTNRLPMRFVAHGSIDLLCYDTVRTVILAPSVLFVSQDDYKMLRIGLAFQYGRLAVGIAGSSNNQVVGSLGYRTGRIRLGYSYDVHISKLGIIAAGSHEITFSFAFRFRARRACFRANWFSTASF